MEHIQTVLEIAKPLADLSKKLYEVTKSLKDHDAERRVDEILDELRDLKQSASRLEDENRELREKLRFKSDDYSFRTPFWYDRAHPNRALCPKCHAKQIVGPMGEPGQGCGPDFRKCLVCDHGIEVGHRHLPEY